MFGYIRVDRANLLGKEYDAYKGIYCALCKQLGRDYSAFARFILSYDCTFYAMLALDLSDQPPCYTQGRCRFNPFKRCNYAQSKTEALPLAAALSVITAYYKLMDNLADSPWYMRLGYRLLQPVFARWKRKAAKRYPEIDASVRRMMEKQRAAEADPACSLDQAAEPTAGMLSDMCGLLTEHIPLRAGLDPDSTKRILRVTGYHIGRWIYLIDAADDYEKDGKRHNFNPYRLNAPTEQTLTAHIEATLNHALSEALLSYGLLPPGRFDHIIQNVLRSSCVMIQQKVLDTFNNEHQDIQEQQDQET